MTEVTDHQARADIQSQCRHCETIQQNCRDRRERDAADRTAMIKTLDAFDARLDQLEDQMTALQTRIGMWAAGGAILGALLIQVGFKVFG